ncbi:hypothetical protein Tco_1403954 [Tanacetum coccineum]
MAYSLLLNTAYRSSGTELEPKRHFKTLSLDELRSHDFNLLSDQEYLEEEVAETMAKTMKQYMSKTRVDYGSGRFRSEDANEHIEKVLEIVDLFHILNITIDQVMLRAFPMSLTGAASRWLRNELTGLQEVILFYNGLGTPTRQILDSRGAIASKTTADAKIAIQEMVEYSHK